MAELMAAAGQPVPAVVLSRRLEALRHEPGAVLIALEWGPPSGIIAVNWARTLDADTPSAQVTTLLVGPDERRRGVARLLLKAGAQAARTAGCGVLRLNASPDRPDLHAFCRATGFDQAGASFIRPLRKRA